MACRKDRSNVPTIAFKEVIEMGWLNPKSSDDVDRSIANVRDLGSRASKEDRETAAKAAKQAGSTGNKAREAFKGK